MLLKISLDVTIGVAGCVNIYLRHQRGVDVADNIVEWMMGALCAGAVTYFLLSLFCNLRRRGRPTVQRDYWSGDRPRSYEEARHRRGPVAAVCWLLKLD